MSRQYTPEVFDVADMAAARQISLPPGTSTTDQRWQAETLFLSEAIIRDCHLSSESILLDYGCGVGRLARPLIEATGCSVLGVDISPSMRTCAVEYVSDDRFTAISPDAFERLVDSGSLRVDAAIAVWVLQHCDNVATDLSLIRRSLASGGRLLVVNRQHMSIPTAAGWVDDGTDVWALLDRHLTTVAQTSLPEAIAIEPSDGPSKIGCYTTDLPLSEKLAQPGLPLIEAERIFSNITSEASDNRDALAPVEHAMAMILYRHSDFERAEKLILSAIRNTSLPRYIANLGAVALSLKHYELAESCSRMAVMFRPANTSAVKNLAIANLYLERYQAAETAFRKFIELAPGDPTGPANLGAVYYGLRDYDRAEGYLMKALDMNNDLPAIHAQLGKVLLENGRLAEAGTHLQRALTLNPGDVDANFTMAFLRLAQGDFTEGWHYYASRFKTGQARVIRQHDSPRWEGQELQGRHLLILTEQGLGDSILSFRCIHPLLERGGRITLEASPPLVRLFSMQPGEFDVIERNTALPGADYHTTTMSLPGLLGDTPDLNQQASLVVSTALTQHWRDRLGTATGFRIGINWQGGPTFLRDRWRSFDLGHFGPIADREGINLVSLQTGETGTRQIPSFQRRHQLQVIDGDPEGETRDMADTAAIMMNMDLIITSCTSVANLAGALGLPTWVLVSNAPDWRWMAEGDRTPWFPSVRVFRQSEPGNWDELFFRVEGALDEFRRTIR